jgi:hypothetical protein
MAISNFPGNIRDAIQEGFLERRWIDALMPKLGYRDGATKEPFSANVGESITKTRASLLPIGDLDPINPASNTPLDDGLTNASVWNVEQYSLPLNQYGKRTADLNTIADKVAIRSQLLKNTSNLGTQSATNLDLQIRNQLLNAYMGGNTRVTVTLGAPAPVIAVDDIRGFQFSFANGFPGPSVSASPVPTSPTANQDVLVGSNVYTLIGAVPDIINTSSAVLAGGISGTLTFSTNVSVSDATLYNPVISTVGSFMVRPNGRQTTAVLTPTDVFTLSDILAAVAFLENNNVPKIDGFYNCYLDATSKQELFSDPNFVRLFISTMFTSQEFKNLSLSEGLGVRFIQINTAPIQPNFVNSSGNVITVHRPIIMGDECVMESDFAGMDEWLQEADVGAGYITSAKGIYMVMRPPIDRQLQFVSQSWLYVGGFVVPTDFLSNSLTIPTATDGYYKRAVTMEHA